MNSASQNLLSNNPYFIKCGSQPIKLPLRDCFLINCVEKIILAFRVNEVVSWSATMPSLKKMKIFKDTVIGCGKAECMCK
jgi:hypothetical protein